MSARGALRIGTRASALALWQAHHVARSYPAQPGAPPVELVHIRTAGRRADRRAAVEPRRAAPSSRRRSIAPCSAARWTSPCTASRTCPTVLEAGLELAATLTRDDPRDALVEPRRRAAGSDCPHGARVGTSSLRRRAFSHAAAPGSEAARAARQRADAPRATEARATTTPSSSPPPGLRASVCSSTLASTSLRRVSRRPSHRASSGVRTRAAMTRRCAGCAPLDDRAARIAATAERALLRRLEGGCQVPLGALATLDGRHAAPRRRACARSTARAR